MILGRLDTAYVLAGMVNVGQQVHETVTVLVNVRQANNDALFMLVVGSGSRLSSHYSK